MTLVEGISNEVLLAFIVTILLVVIAIYYIFSEGANTILRPLIVQDGSINDENIDRPINTANVGGIQSETPGGNDMAGARQSETIANDSSRSNATREEASNLTCNRDSQDVTEQITQSENTREDTLRRRVVNDAESRQDQSTSSQDETMVVKVKHNENIQTFNVSKNTTVIELKR